MKPASNNNSENNYLLVNKRDKANVIKFITGNNLYIKIDKLRYIIKHQAY